MLSIDSPEQRNLVHPINVCHVFLRHFDLKPDTIAPLLIKLIAQCPPWTVSIDRTHWKLGMTHVNLLVLSINWHNVAVPLF